MKRMAFALVLALSPCAHADERAIVKEVVVKASPEAAWRTWTTKEGIQSFFAPEAIVDPRPEGAFSIHINPFAAPGLKGADGMRFLALQENRMLSFTWNAPPHLPDARRQRTSVVVRFAPAGEGATRVTLHHSGWGEGGQWDQAFDYFDNAWGRVLANFRKRFDEGPVDWTEHLARMKAATPR
jgi:uncharacterized protein YndB with AHSA1/START domain